MLSFSCPVCGAAYELGEEFVGKKVCCASCEAKFYVPAAGKRALVAAENNFDSARAVPPGRIPNASVDTDVTMPGKRDRKPDGRFDIGDLVMKRYKVLAELGQGGMGVVYKCFDETAGIEVALKALPPELSHNTLEMEDIKDNFQIVHDLHHPNIASSNTLEKDNSNGNYYLIMECCEGEDLRRWLKRKRKEGKITLDDILPIVKQVADALDYAHKMKIIHRDIKPGNIMINAEGEIKVLDFGLAAQIHTSMTRVSMAYYGTSGTGPYMAPEQWRGRSQGAPADQYALAVMTYEMLSGHLPFESSDATVLREAVLNDTPEEIADIPKSAQDAIERAMSKNPFERFENCSDFAAALSGKKVKTAKIQKKRCSLKWIAILAIFILLCSTALGLYFSWGKIQNAVQQKADAFPEVQVIVDNSMTNFISPEEYDSKDLTEEVYRLQSQVESMKRDIDSADYERSETLRQYVEALKHFFTSGYSAVKKKNFTSAYENFKKAETVAKWITINAPLLPKVKQLQVQVNEQKKLADEFEASRIARNIYADAEKKIAKSVTCCKSGEIELAIENLEAALSCYQKAYHNARDFKLNELIKSAERAKINNQWQRMYDCASDALKIDSNSAEAQILKNEAKKHLPPSLVINAYVEGKVVPATVKAVKTAVDMSSIPWQLQKGSVYSFEISYMQNNDEFIGIIPSFTCTENGPSQIDIKLKKFDKKIILPNGNFIEMVKVEAGTFTMSAEDGANYDDEIPHKATLTRDFYIGKTEVTQAQWKAVMGRNPSNATGNDLPVVNVSWRDAIGFCIELNGMGIAPEGWKFTLPTETQWEYAARGGKKSFGYKYSGSNNIDKVAWYVENSGEKLHPVATKQANELGIYDMSGNVYEWCSDWYGSYNGDAVDPVGPLSGLRRVIRGGSSRHFGYNFYCIAKDCRSANRNSYIPNASNDNLGFRLALVPIE